jgi:hypothetical protein
MLAFDNPVLDLAVNGDDLYVGVDQKVEFYTYDHFLKDGEAVTSWKVDSVIRSVRADPNSLMIGVCTATGCSLLDARAPRLIGISAGADFQKFLPSPFLKVAAIVTSRGFVTIDERRPEVAVARLCVASVPTDLHAQWLPRSRLLALAVPGNFFVCSLYMRKEVLECYPIELEPVVRLHANLSTCVVMQKSVCNVFGGYGKNISVPAPLITANECCNTRSRK